MKPRCGQKDFAFYFIFFVCFFGGDYKATLGFLKGTTQVITDIILIVETERMPSF